MSFKLILGGIAEMGAGIMLTVGVATNVLSPQIYMYAMIALTIIFGLVLALVSIWTNGILEPFISAKLNNKNMIAMITSSKRIRLMAGKERGGLTKTPDGYIMTPPDTVYTWPNGAKGGFGYFKYATTLPPKIVAGATALKEQGIVDGEALDKMVDKDKDFTVKFE